MEISDYVTDGVQGTQLPENNIYHMQFPINIVASHSLNLIIEDILQSEAAESNVSQPEVQNHVVNNQRRRRNCTTRTRWTEEETSWLLALDWKYGDAADPMQIFKFREFREHFHKKHLKRSLIQTRLSKLRKPASQNYVSQLSEMCLEIVKDLPELIYHRKTENKMRINKISPLKAYF